MKLFDQISINEFLNEYWEKKPYIFRNISFSKENSIKVEDLLMMAEDEYYETRAIFQNLKGDWDVQDGPFASKIFKEQKNKWTFIAHNTEHYFLDIKNIKKQLEVLPTWLFDDVMATYSSTGSSVGAHIDNYNVFIMQTLGTRKWLLQQNPIHDYQEKLPVRILKEFIPDTEIMLEEGDMIYIPPHFAHHGISQSESISLSFGYKSLENKTIIDHLCVNLLDKYKSDSFFKTKLQKTNDPGTIDKETLSKLKEHIQHDLSDDVFFAKSMGALNSESKRPTEILEINHDEFQEHAKENPLFKDEFVRHCFIEIDSKIHLFVNKNEFIITNTQKETLNHILNFDHHTEIVLKDLPEIHNELYELTKLGILFFDGE